MTLVESGMLLARIRLRAPAARSILVAGPYADVRVADVARDLATAGVESSLKVRWLDATTHAGSEIPIGVEVLEVLEGELQDLAKARIVLASLNAYTVMYAGGILDSPTALLLSAAADAVLVVAREGKTNRADLDQTRKEVESAGGQLIGAVLL